MRRFLSVLALLGCFAVVDANPPARARVARVAVRVRAPVLQVHLNRVQVVQREVVAVRAVHVVHAVQAVSVFNPYASFALATPYVSTVNVAVPYSYGATALSANIGCGAAVSAFTPVVGVDYASIRRANCP